MDHGRITNALEELGYPTIQPLDIGPLLIAILQTKDARQIYSIPYLLLSIIRDKYAPSTYLQKLIRETHNQEIKESLTDFLAITCEIYRHLHKENDNTAQQLQSLATELVPQENTKKIRQAYKEGTNYRLPINVIISLPSAERNLFNYETRRNIQAHTNQKQPLREEFRTQYLLSHLFAPRQKEILMKKYLQLPLTKTENEYYSRTIKPKIDSILNPEIRTILEKTRLQ